jgi:periplasmic divalent cation tolerance protein
VKETDFIVVLVTTADLDEARQISEALLEKKKVACVNIIPAVYSHFWWEGRLDSGEESLLIAKTRASLLPEIINLVKEKHSYDTPEVIALPIIGGSQDYLQWIEASVS